jgi:bifunctional non-homologous end joining protein LigD
LIGLAQIGALEIHPWASRIDHLEKPDTLIFDLDPDPALDWEQVVFAAWHLRGILQAKGLKSFVKTSGGKGLHVQVPITPDPGWNDLKEFSRRVAADMAADQPRHYTINPRKASRQGKIFIDYLRNARGATSIAPYCVRSRPGAPLSMPLDWLELSHRIGPEHFNANNALERLRVIADDPWKTYFQAQRENTRNLAQHALLQPTD